MDSKVREVIIEQVKINAKSLLNKYKYRLDLADTRCLIMDEAVAMVARDIEKELRQFILEENFKKPAIESLKHK